MSIDKFAIVSHQSGTHRKYDYGTGPEQALPFNERNQIGIAFEIKRNGEWCRCGVAMTDKPDAAEIQEAVAILFEAYRNPELSLNKVVWGHDPLTGNCNLTAALKARIEAETP